MIRNLVLAASLAALPAAALAQTPPPPPPGATAQAQPYLMAAGAGDVFEITSSQVALQKSQNPQVRRFATMLIDHHTTTTNNALVAAKSGGVTPPPPVLDQNQRAMIGELMAAAPADFDRVFLAQQLPAHQAALAVNQGYAQGGDVPALRQAAAATVPVVRGHIAQVQRMQAAM